MICSACGAALCLPHGVRVLDTDLSLPLHCTAFKTGTRIQSKSPHTSPYTLSWGCQSRGATEPGRYLGVRDREEPGGSGCRFLFISSLHPPLPLQPCGMSIWHSISRGSPSMGSFPCHSGAHPVSSRNLVHAWKTKGFFCLFPVTSTNTSLSPGSLSHPHKEWQTAANHTCINATQP